MSAPGCTTGAEVTIGVHWLRATTKEATADAISTAVAEALGADVEVREGGRHCYDTTHVVGPVVLWSHSARPDMGVCMEVTGSACEALGPDGLVKLWGLQEWNATRLDLAVDDCPFTPRQVRDAWIAGDVNTRVKVSAEAIEGREEWRRCEWSEHVTGDLFGMGSRSSTQYARCYDRRGMTRFELELKNGGTKNGRQTASVVAPLVVQALASGVGLRSLVLGLVQRFVTFVDRSADTNLARCPQLSWWAAFTQGVERARLWSGQAVVRRIEDMAAWAKRSVAPTLAACTQALGRGWLDELVAGGAARLGRRHVDSLRLAGLQGGAV